MQVKTYQVYEELVFEIKHDLLLINYTIRIKDKQSVDVNQYHIIFQNIYFNTWYIQPLKSSQTLGRGKDADINIQNDWISNVHVKINRNNDQWYIEDMNSTNGTYVNGKKIREQRLYLGDWIVLADIQMYFFEKFIVMNAMTDRLMYEILPDVRQTRKCLVLHDQKMNPSQKIIKKTLEAPVMDEMPIKSKLFQSVGSSCLILISSGFMAIVTYLIHPDRLDQVMTMIMTSGSMFLAFLLYGLWNRNNNWKESIGNYEQKIEKYNMYLQNFRKQVWKEREVCLQQEARMEKICTDFSKSNYGYKHPLWIGKESKMWITVEVPKVSYEYIGHPLYEKMNQVITEVEQPMFRNCYLPVNAFGWLPVKRKNDIHHLFFQWIWQGLSQEYKWIWNVSDIDCHHPYLALECCQENRSRLCIKNMTDAERIRMQLKKHHQYVVVSDEPSLINTLKIQSTFILISKDKPLEAQSIHINEDRAVDFIQIWRSISGSHCKEKSIHFFESLGLESLYQLDLNKWYTQQKVQLHVPVGYQLDGHFLYLDFLKQGPHGLVAGTTGSGKSEWLSSILMQLILRNHPKYFQYILIDFKGGAFGKAFYDFPHCAGMITNLESRAIDRWMLSLSTELRNRQHRFNRIMQKHPEAIASVGSYNRYAKEPMSHLFIIVDEFASIKDQYPEQMQNMKELARIGRSLGIHLILSTQKPMGIVDEQIWSNSKWKVCLRVNSEEDSREILHNGTGAYLQGAGSFICDDGEGIQTTAKGFYLQETVYSKDQKSWREVDEKDRLVIKKPDSIKPVLQYLSRCIRKQNLSHRWIVLPDVSESKIWNHVLLKLDLPAQQKQKDWTIPKGNNCIVYSSNPTKMHQFIKTCITQFQMDSIYTIGIHGVNDVVDQSFGTGIYPSIEKGTLLIEINAVDGWEKYLTNDQLRLIVFVGTCTHSWQQIMNQFHHRLAIAWEDIDAIRYYFGEFSIPVITGNYGLMKVEKEMIYFYCQPKIPKPLQRRRHSIQIQDGYFIGIDIQTHQEVVWKHKTKLVICFAQSSYKKKIVTMIEIWLQINPMLVVATDFQVSADIYLISVVHQSDLFQSRFYIENQYDLDMMWIGLGLHDYGYLINRKPPYERHGNLVFWEEQNVWMVDMDA